jgi:endonuclease YncB( thermonuclease family)
MRRKLFAATAVAVLTLGPGAWVRPGLAQQATSQAAFRARVIGIYDGDTVLIRRQGSSRWEQIRMYGVNAPEYDPPAVQRFGRNAFEFVYWECYGQDVIVRPVVRDFYGRLVAEIVLSDGRTLQQALLDNGMAWVYRSFVFASDRNEFLTEEAVARSQRKGLWADQNPTPPWVWRDAHH